MKRQIELQNERVEYLLRKNFRSRRLRLVIHPGGELIVTAPVTLSLSRIEDFICQKAQWILEKLKIAKNQKVGLSLGRNQKEYLTLKNQALKIITQKVEHYALRHNFCYNKISIRNQKTRWGSCSQKGNLNYNYKVALLPDELADYIVVHELCHLKELNHGGNFWQEVKNILPNYKERARRIKKLSRS